MKTVLFVLLNEWSDWESAYLASALHVLGNGQYEVKTVGLTTDYVTSIGGLRVVPDFTLRSVPNAYEALILVGGMSWRTKAAKQVGPLVKACLAKGKVLGGICDASGFLGTLGVLNDIKHTSNDLNDLKAWAGKSYTGEKNYILEQAVSDQKIITANGTAALEFAKEVLLTLQAAPKERIIEWYNFHKLGFYNAPFPKM